jgi:hypothetical protein
MKKPAVTTLASIAAIGLLATAFVKIYNYLKD